MKPIVARDQVALGAMRCLRLALAGMSYRLFRSGITVSILALAVAFLVHMLSFSILAQRTEHGAVAELAESRQLGEIVTRIGSEDTPSKVRAALAAGDTERIAEYRRFAGAAANPEAAQDLDAAQGAARVLAQLGQFLNGLSPAARAVLLGDLSPEQSFERLAEPENLKVFMEQLRTLGVVLPELPPARLTALFLRERPQLEAAVQRIIAGHQSAIRAVHAAFPGKSPDELAEAPPAELGSTLRAAGFAFDDADLPALRAFGARLADRQLVSRLLLDPDVRAKVARRLGVPLTNVSLDTLARSVDDRAGAEWLRGVFLQADKNLQLPAERLLGLLEHSERQRLLAGVAGEQRSASESEGLFGLDARARWLLALSFLVCIVGVANAMLMSVTERFSEIATMKCLGAMDGFVMLMFVLEAVIQGMVGGVIGVAVGLLLALVRALVEFGALLGGALGAFGGLTLAVLGSLVVGVALAALAAVGPAWVAARLSPMEAMRVD